MNYTKHGYRINKLREASGYTWIFLPEGSGLGSEYLLNVCRRLNLPGSIFLLDYPKDGTNTEGTLELSSWREGLIDVLKTCSNPVLVTHGFGGMLALSIPELEAHLAGLVLMNTTTGTNFLLHINAMKEQYDLPDLIPGASYYHFHPSDTNYEAFWSSYKYYCFTREELGEGEKIMSLFAFNSAAYDFAITNVYPEFKCRWAPHSIPAMTIASEHDYICSPQIFLQDTRFQRVNIKNKLIAQAGHFPWLVYFDAVQQCFDEFVVLLKNYEPQ